MSLTDVQVVNSALEMIAAQTQIAALNDGSPAANAATVIYAPTVQLMLRELDPDFARYTAALSSAGAVTPVTPWQYEYTYPSDCLRVRQVRPASGGYDVNDPQPVRWNVAFDVISAVKTKVILTNQASALGVYTSSGVTEAQWDSAFTDAVVRRLANPLAMALSGRPDFAEKLLEQSAAMASTADATDDAMITGR
jgi:hypothetical protein